MQWKKTAAVALLAALCAVPGYAAERPKLADGELFVSERVVKDGKVIYQAADAHTDWEHDSEKAVPGLVCTAFIPPKAGQDAPELASIKKLTTQQEKVLQAGAGIPVHPMPTNWCSMRPWIPMDRTGKWPSPRQNCSAVC